MFVMICPLFLLLAPSAGSAAYPSTYPVAASFLKEMADNLPVGNPKYSGSHTKKDFTTKESGGFVRGVLDFDYNTLSLDCFAGFRCRQPGSYIIYHYGLFGGTMPQPPSCDWHACNKSKTYDWDSAAVNKYTKPKTLPASRNPKGYCLEYEGHGIGANGGEEQVKQWSAKWATREQTGLCKNYNEPTFCALSYRFQQMCSMNYVSHGSRKYIWPCFDNEMVFWKSCPVYSANGIADYIDDLEPVAYSSQITPVGQFLIYSGVTLPDRVCYPVSYYGGVAADKSLATKGVMRPVMTLLLIFFASV